WTDLARDGELVCINRDLGAVFDPRHWTKDATDTYLCYQKIYSPRHRRGAAPDLAAVSDARPLRCVLFNEAPQDTPAFQAWLAGMLARYRLRSAVPYHVRSVERKRGPTWDQLYLVYEFVPKPEPPGAGTAGAPPAGRGAAPLLTVKPGMTGNEQRNR